MARTEGFDKKRDEILNSSEQLFIEKAYELATTSGILKGIGIAKGTFYYYFKSKEEVMDSVIMRMIDEESDYAKMILARKELSPIEKLITALLYSPYLSGRNEQIKSMYAPSNALMKQRGLQRTLELICPLYAEMIEEGNENNYFSFNNPLSDIQLFIVGSQTIVDFSQLAHSKVGLNVETII